VDGARAELLSMISDVTASTAHRYRVIDDRGRWLGPMTIIPIPEANTFAAVTFTTDEAGIDRAELMTSPDLLDWTFRTELAGQAAMPDIVAAADGGYVVAWEQEPDRIHTTIARYESWEDLLAARPVQRFDVPITMPACGEGTPSIESASSERVELSFHYHGDCTRDLEAWGSTDWETWESRKETELDRALIDLGVNGHIGDRDLIDVNGVDLMLIEGQRELDVFDSVWTYLYDDITGKAEHVDFQTHAGSFAIGNPSATWVKIDGRDALVVTVYIFTEGSRGGEDGELIFYVTR
jgi:hypothetical protein